MKLYSPWAEVDSANAIPLNPRLDTLEGKTIGLYAHFKGHSPVMLEILSELLQERFPTTKFKAIQIKRDTMEAFKLPEFDAELKEWLKDVDGVITAYGDAGSCCMFHAYNTVYIERLGKPAVMLCKKDLLKAGKKAAASRMCPQLRFVTSDIMDLTWVPELDEGVREGLIRPGLRKIVDEVIAGLTAPLTEAEKTPFVKDNSAAAPFEYDGPAEKISDYYYRRGWTTGLPICAPTEEAVKEMLRGTDLPADTVVAELSPMMGKATVEKIAVNAVMAGCLPTYLPVLIAAVKATADPIVHLEGWTCSVASWAPVITVSGKVGQDIGINTAGAAISQYSKAGAAIARAYAYIIMNISGVRPGEEDMSEVGHEGRQGLCIADRIADDNPWAPLHVDFGLKEEDSAVVMSWYQERYEGHGNDAAGCFKSMYRVVYGGYDRGVTYVVSPGFVRALQRGGFNSRKEVLRYIQQYCRHSAANVNFRWMYANNHVPEGVQLPTSKEESAPVFWTTDHMMIVVSGSNYDSTCVNFSGGGEHGGPACAKIELPAAWDELVKEYEIKPEYLSY